VQEFNPNH